MRGTYIAYGAQPSGLPFAIQSRSPGVKVLGVASDLPIVLLCGDNSITVKGNYIGPPLIRSLTADLSQ